MRIVKFFRTLTSAIFSGIKLAIHSARGKYTISTHLIGDSKAEVDVLTFVMHDALSQMQEDIVEVLKELDLPEDMPIETEEANKIVHIAIIKGISKKNDLELDEELPEEPQDIIN